MLLINVHYMTSTSSNDSKNTGFEDPYSLSHYVETAAHIIESVNDSVSTTSSVDS